MGLIRSLVLILLAASPTSCVLQPNRSGDSQYRRLEQDEKWTNFSAMVPNSSLSYTGMMYSADVKIIDESNASFTLIVGELTMVVKLRLKGVLEQSTGGGSEQSATVRMDALDFTVIEGSCLFAEPGHDIVITPSGLVTSPPDNGPGVGIVLSRIW